MSPSVLAFKPKIGQPHIYESLADHQRSEEWDFQDLARDLHRWALIFDQEFALQVPEVSLGVASLRRSTLGHFRYGHNGFGLKGEIVINKRHLVEGGWWDTLGTLLHEMLHGWQQAHGKPGKRNYHNKQFREKARSLGLIVDQQGHTEYLPDSPFLRLLGRHGIDVPPLEGVVAVAPVKPRGDSKLKKWSCACTNVRVAIADFRALCLKCGEVFRPA